MKIAITTQGKDMSSQLDLRFGRAKYIIIADSETGEFSVHDNVVNLNAAQGAGIQTASNISQLDAEVVITGNVGPNAFRTLNAAGIKIFIAEQQSVIDVINLFKAGKLKQAGQANVEGHWI